MMMVDCNITFAFKVSGVFKVKNIGEKVLLDIGMLIALII